VCLDYIAIRVVRRFEEKEVFVEGVVDGTIQRYHVLQVVNLSGPMTSESSGQYLYTYVVPDSCTT
jgi:hypothetical protein